MITEAELNENGFSVSENKGGDWIHDVYTNVTFSYNDGRITYARNDDDYTGLAVRINTIEKLILFLTFLR